MASDSSNDSDVIVFPSDLSDDEVDDDFSLPSASPISSCGESPNSTNVQYGGYEYQLVQGMDSNLEDIYICKICHLPSRDPQLSICCGHTFCKSCLDNMKQHSRTSNSKLCPVCRNKKFEVFPNKQVDRKIRNLHVFCVNKERGCDWQGELNDLDVHLNSDCKYEDVECTHGCGKMLQRQHITLHMEVECPHRKINCQYCNLSGISDFITGDHKEECPKVVIHCPNHCETDNILREDMEEHRKVCSLEVVSCKYMKLGCGTRLARTEVEKHRKEKMEEHLLLATEKLEKLENAMSRLEDVVSQLKWGSCLTSQVSQTGIQVAPVTFRITGFADKKSERSSWMSQNFYGENELGDQTYVQVAFARSYLKVFVSLCLIDYDGLIDLDHDHDCILGGRFDLTILNQISDNEHYSKQIVLDDNHSDEAARREGRHSWGISHFISYDRLCMASSTCQYVKDDSMYIKVSYSSPDVEDD